ncbi:swarming motility protein SwrB [Sporosarcina sp. NCCP-2716]|uniref:hypothetical protein n=1 Tax=Sporosarcina sp. NCCP-2716 TaxID=2943679 RepID=UPI002040D92C|nr:hypothetical protein [Sporosarcina sp. NCCP-2716]GKV67825.1 swarming motility protein SwrB [Sporosarcina sp. NCCP-2716]
MTAIVLTVLFILQLGSFYVIALLYMRLSKLDGTEKKQRQLMKEMEDSLALYIADVKEENDRLIEQLTNRPDAPGIRADSRGAGASNAGTAADPAGSSIEKPLTAVSAVKPPALKVMDSYRSQQTAKPRETVEPPESVQQQEPDGETGFEPVYRLHAEGLTAGEIASRLGKGKTEIELILKFKQ